MKYVYWIYILSLYSPTQPDQTDVSSMSFHESRSKNVFHFNLCSPQRAGVKNWIQIKIFFKLCYCADSLLKKMYYCAEFVCSYVEQRSSSFA